jgi:NAD(P)-dependent dehydrogenase (short-subunit alcohol dehydrogenase family)
LRKRPSGWCRRRPRAGPQRGGDPPGCPSGQGLRTGCHSHPEGGRAKIVASDVSRYADAQRLAETALEHYGRIDILVNNAGVIEPISTLTNKLCHC